MKTSTEDMNMPIMAMSHCSAAFAPWPKNLGSFDDIHNDGYGLRHTSHMNK